MVKERENSGEKEEKAKMTRKADQQRKINQKRQLWHEVGRTARDDTATAQAVSGGSRGGNNTTCIYQKNYAVCMTAGNTKLCTVCCKGSTALLFREN